MATQPTDTSKPRLRTVGDELTVIAQRAQAFTNASGTAIALSEGNADEIVCRARSGSAAPDVGAALRVEGSFTGLCIQTGKELRCDDAETDTRVDTAAIRALGIRSMVVTPIRDENKVVGVLACFAPTAHAFTITHVAVLKTMADQISVLLQKERRGKEEGVQPEAPAPGPKPVASAPAPLPPPVVIKPASSGSATAAATARVPAIARVEPVKTEVAAPVPFPKREEKQKQPEVKASFGTFDSVAAEEKKSAGNSKLMFGAVAVLAVAGVSGFFVMRKPSTAVPVQHAQETAASTTPSGQQFASMPANVTVTPESSAQPAPTHGSVKPASFTDTRKPEPRVEARNEVKEPRNERAADKNVIAADKTEKPAPSTVSLTSGPSRLSGVSANQSNADVAPTLSISSSTGALSALARPVANSAPTIAQSELEPMRVTRTVPPVYPAIARVRRLSGDVVVEVSVGKDGRVRNPKLISGPQIFRDAAFDAVKQWQFKPATLNGQAIEQTTQIKMVFNP